MTDKPEGNRAAGRLEHRLPGGVSNLILRIQHRSSVEDGGVGMCYGGQAPDSAESVKLGLSVGVIIVGRYGSGSRAWLPS